VYYLPVDAKAVISHGGSRSGKSWEPSLY